MAGEQFGEYLRKRRQIGVIGGSSERLYVLNLALIIIKNHLSKLFEVHQLKKFKYFGILSGNKGFFNDLINKA